MITPPPILLTSKALAKFDFGDLLNHIIDFKNFQLPTTLKSFQLKNFQPKNFQLKNFQLKNFQLKNFQLLNFQLKNFQLSTTS